ncbi:MAG: hypothetical protein P8Q32_00710 [Candidatus Thalassarchaeaceae archaeon]|jgi:hypothetical protein|nr:hypothetical protein [Candidatus Thalassarchaeaceae archaeon]|tara:strand:- start:2808 stop:3464 length:657 start_codon:yes stop_codon:yes gene_type:complete
MQMRGKVRFRFRSPESDIDVLIEGEYDVVNSIRDELGLQGRVGFIQPLSARLVHGHEPELSSALGDEKDLEDLSDENKLPGPPPDPTSIPAVVRRIGDLDIKAEISDLDGPSRTEPQIEYIREFLESIDELEPLKNNLSGDPMAEAWLQIVLTLVVRQHGQTSLPISAIEELIGEKINKEGTELELFLNRLWIMGRLELIYGGAEVHYAPNPSWLVSQ